MMEDRTMKQDAQRIGFVGLGRMGLPICLRLCAAGHKVTVLPSPHGTGTLPSALSDAGCDLARTASELAMTVDVLITCLPSSEDVEAVLVGTTGFFAGLEARTGVLHIDHTSGMPAVTRRLAAAWRDRNGMLADAAMSGTPQLAQTGDLILLCGATAEQLERVKAISAAYAKEVIHVGEVSSGHMLRLIGGIMGYGTAMLASEAFLLCTAAGIGTESLSAMITGSGADSRTFQAMATTERDGRFSPARRNLALATVLKDLDALRRQSAEIGCAVPVTALITEQMRQAASRGGEDAVISDLTECLRALASHRAAEQGSLS